MWKYGGNVIVFMKCRTLSVGIAVIWKKIGSWPHMKGSI